MLSLRGAASGGGSWQFPAPLQSRGSHSHFPEAGLELRGHLGGRGTQTPDGSCDASDPKALQPLLFNVANFVRWQGHPLGEHSPVPGTRAPLSLPPQKDPRPLPALPNPFPPERALPLVFTGVRNLLKRDCPVFK